MHHTTVEHEDAEETCRRLFQEEPGLSIGNAARQLANSGVPLATDTISRIRQSVRAAIERAQQPATYAPLRSERAYPPRPYPVRAAATPPPVPPIIRRKEPFNPPRMAQEPAREVAVPVVAVAVKEAAPVSAAGTSRVIPEVKSSTPAERKKWFEDYALENPKISAGTGRKVLLEHFGVSLGTTTVAEIIKAARDVHGIAPKSVIQTPVVPAFISPPVVSAKVAPVAAAPTGDFGFAAKMIKELASRMREIGVTKLELVGNDVVFDLRGSLMEASES